MSSKAMPKDVAAKLQANDSELTKIEFVDNSVFSMKASEYAQMIAEGLRKNTYCKELIIDKCNLVDVSVVAIADALRENSTLERLMLPNNKLGPVALTAIAECLKVNNTIKEFGLLGNTGSSGGKWGDASLTALIEALEQNNTSLTKIVWRLDNRLSWKITKLMSRNVEIGRRKAAGMDVSDMDPNLKREKGESIPPTSTDEVPKDFSPVPARLRVQEDRMRKRAGSTPPGVVKPIDLDNPPAEAQQSRSSLSTNEARPTTPKKEREVKPDVAVTLTVSQEKEKEATTPEAEAEKSSSAVEEESKPILVTYKGEEYLVTEEQLAFVKKFQELVPPSVYDELYGQLVKAFLM